MWPNSSYPFLGLHPKNVLYVHLYNMACGDDRLATFDGAYLQNTLDVVTAEKVLDEYADYFPTRWHRRWAFEAMWEINRIALEVRGGAEHRERLARQRQQELKNMRPGKR